MRKIVSMGAVAVAALGILAAPANANADCGAIVFDVGGLAYVAHDPDGDVNAWIYLESNNIAGLQRGGATPDGFYDTCQAGMPNPDMVIF